MLKKFAILSSIIMLSSNIVWAGVVLQYACAQDDYACLRDKEVEQQAERDQFLRGQQDRLEKQRQDRVPPQIPNKQMYPRITPLPNDQSSRYRLTPG